MKVNISVNQYNSKQCFKYLSDSKMLDNEEISEMSENDEDELSETH